MEAGTQSSNNLTDSHTLISYYVLGTVPSTGTTAENKGQRPPMQLIFWWGEDPFQKLGMTRQAQSDVYMHIRETEGFFFFFNFLLLSL